ncbi:hypothetical protein MNEG_12755, partial [Monoraphidium neglectum]
LIAPPWRDASLLSVGCVLDEALRLFTPGADGAAAPTAAAAAGLGAEGGGGGALGAPLPALLLDPLAAAAPARSPRAAKGRGRGGR